jgi:hypothetical protein
MVLELPCPRPGRARPARPASTGRQAGTARRLLATLAAGLLLAACQSAPPPDRTAAAARQMAALHPPDKRGEVAAEAQRLAAAAVATTDELVRGYRVFAPSWLHNCLVNTGARERGLCWHYMEDLFAALANPPPQHFELRCAVRDLGNLWREHHCVVLLVRGRPFAEGLVLDPWKRPGRLLINPVVESRRPWQDDPAYTAALLERAAKLAPGRP